jgi:hypothetical protein
VSEHVTSLRSVDRAADGRARIHGQELRRIVARFEAAEISLSSVEQLVAELQALAARMDDTVPAPQSLDAWRTKKEDGR